MSTYIVETKQSLGDATYVVVSKKKKAIHGQIPGKIIKIRKVSKKSPQMVNYNIGREDTTQTHSSNH